eukprot:585026-Pleurochrysis_carterae.AAC.3
MPRLARRRLHVRARGRACCEGMASRTSVKASEASPWHSTVCGSASAVAKSVAKVSTQTEPCCACSARPKPATLRSPLSKKLRPHARRTGAVTRAGIGALVRRDRRARAQG